MNNWRGASLLAALIAGTGLLLTLAHLLLQPRIAALAARHAERIDFEMLALQRGTGDGVRPLVVGEGGDGTTLRSGTTIALVYRAHALAGLVIPVTTAGYNGDIDLLVGLNRDGTITRVRALRQHESRGIGDAIDRAKSAWIDQFAGRTSADSVRLRRDGGDIDQITGATVTSRAVANAAQAALRYYAAHRDALLKEETVREKTQ